MKHSVKDIISFFTRISAPVPYCWRTNSYNVMSVLHSVLTQAHNLLALTGVRGALRLARNVLLRQPLEEEAARVQETAYRIVSRFRSAPAVEAIGVCSCDSYTFCCCLSLGRRRLPRALHLAHLVSGDRITWRICGCSA